MKKGRTGVEKLARMLAVAAQKRNESDEATCSIARWFEGPDGDLSDKTFDRISDAVYELAHVAMDGKPDYRRAARALLARIGGKRA